MKTKSSFIIMLILLVSSSLIFAQNKVDTLTNKKIIQLTKIGLQPSVIINKIKISVNIFDVSTEALINLSENSVSTDVINEMMKTYTDQQYIVSSKKDMRDPTSMRASGIYYFDKNDTIKPIKKIDPAVVSGSRSKDLNDKSYSSSKQSSNLSGALSQTQIQDLSPTFYFYFEKIENPGANSWLFAIATNPKEFGLVKLDQSKNARLFQTGVAKSFLGFGGSSEGIPEKDKVPFKINEIAEGIYKVTFNKPLVQGEYCFLYASKAPSMYSNDKVFDFGISSSLGAGYRPNSAGQRKPPLEVLVGDSITYFGDAKVYLYKSAKDRTEDVGRINAWKTASTDIADPMNIGAIFFIPSGQKYYLYCTYSAGGINYFGSADCALHLGQPLKISVKLTK